jgi:hypothetical protein
MGGETEAAWRAVLDDLLARGLAKPDLVIVDGGKGLEAALASLWADVPVQRCTVHKERNLLAHAPTHLHDEIKAEFNDMIHAKTAAEVLARRKAFLARWKLDTSKNLGEAGLICSTVACSGGGSAWGDRPGFSTSKSGWRGCRRRAMTSSGSPPWSTLKCSGLSSSGPCRAPTARRAAGHRSITS